MSPDSEKIADWPRTVAPWEDRCCALIPLLICALVIAVMAHAAGRLNPVLSCGPGEHPGSVACFALR